MITTPIALTVLIPFVGALIITLLDNPRLHKMIVLLSTLGVFINVVLLLQEAGTPNEMPQAILLTLLPQIPLALAAEPLGLLFALTASGLWVISTFYTMGYLHANRSTNQKRFYTCFTFALGCTMGVAMAKNLLTLFIFYELLTLSTWPMVIHKESNEAYRGGRTYLRYLLGSSICLQLFAIIWTWTLANTLDFTLGGILEDHLNPHMATLLLLLYAFGIGKAALMPLHGWLPAAMVAPTPVSALLHAVAVVKAGVFTLLKVGIYIFGIDFLADSGASIPLVWIALTSILLASLLALSKDNLKERLAYSTVSQLSYITLGLALATPLSLAAATLHMVMHAMGKITLFMSAGIITTATGKTLISTMQGQARLLPVTFIAYMIGALCVIGFPLLGGMWSKWILLIATTQTAAWSVFALIILSTLLNIIYLLPPGLRAFFPNDPQHTSHTLRLPRRELLLCGSALCVTALGCIFLFFMTGPLLAFIAPVVEGLGP